jgi:octanoyl-[GcvH]:protein N-octanoyltransferase
VWVCSHLQHFAHMSQTSQPDSPSPGTDPPTEIELIDRSFAGQAALGTGVSMAVLRRVARGDLPSTVRLHRTGRILAFGRIDRLAPGYARAVAIAREHGFEPIERMAGGRAAVFTEGTLCFSHATRIRSMAAGTHDRFRRTAEIVRDTLRAVGADARIGEVAGEYCPGEWSVNAGGRVKLAGIGQRMVAGGAHVGGVLVVRGEQQIREVLVPVYEALGLEWDPATAGSVAGATGAGPPPADGPDPLLEQVRSAFRAELEARFSVREAEIDEETLRLAEGFRAFHAPSV